jgi:selenocysteine lyase/cysteine desulfurase
MSDLSRRAMLAAGLLTTAAATAAAAQTAPAGDPARLATDETYWAKVAGFYDWPRDVIQLEAGQFGAMARPVQAAYETYLRKINRETTLYTRTTMFDDLGKVRAKAAAMLGVDADEIVWTRGGTESMMTLIGGYNRLRPGDAVLYADLDYDSMQTGMAGMAKLRGLKCYTFDLPEPATRQSLIDAYEKQLTAHPDVKLMLVTHLSHRTGLVPPVKEITALAKSRGVDVLLDCGHALGQVDFKLRDLGVDFAGLNLHKWIGSPVGVGLTYIRKDRIGDIDVALAEPQSPRIDSRVHTGTVNYGAQLAVSDAIDFHNSIGLANKAFRMRYLRDRWAEAIRGHPGVEVLTPADPDLHAGITSFRFKGQGSNAQVLAAKTALWERYKIFTVERFGPAKGACVRVSPSFINTPADLDRLVVALRELAPKG